MAPKKELDNFSSWIGLGVKGGGTVGLIGLETMEGSVTNLGFVRHTQSLNLTSIRVGLGLGGGVGMVAIMVFNCPNLAVLHDTIGTDFSVNVAIGGVKWDGVFKALKARKFFSTMTRLNGVIQKASPDDISNIRNSMSYVWSTIEIAAYSPQLVALDIPFAGVGQEVSIHALEGKITIGDLVDSAATTKQRPEPAGGLPGRKY